MKLRLSPGGTVTQGTSKSTAVTVNTCAGQITMHNASLASNTSVGFTVNNSYVASGDFVDVCISGGATATSYIVGADSVAAGSFTVHLRNITGGALGEAVVITFTVTKIAY